MNLDKRGKLLRCLSNGGVACLVTGKKSDHYSLLLGVEGENFLGFDCWWDGKKTARCVEKLVAYKGIVNIQWTREELEIELQQSGWVHLLGKS